MNELGNVMIRRGVPAEAADRRVTAMTQAFPLALVDGYEGLIPELTCAAGDRHVLAAAIRSDADTLVTFNVRDFPESSVKRWDIVVVHPDEFLGGVTRRQREGSVQGRIVEPAPILEVPLQVTSF